MDQRLVNGEGAGDVDREVGQGRMYVVTRGTWITRDSLPYDIFDRPGSKSIKGRVTNERKRVFDGNIIILFVSSKVVFVFVFPPARNARTLPRLTGGRNVREGNEM